MYLTITSDGKAKAHLFGKAMDIVERDDEHIAVKIKSHRMNVSGIRGLPDYRYCPAETIKYKIVEVLEDGDLRVEEVERIEHTRKKKA